MKVLAKPIEVISWFTEDGILNPIRFRIRSDEESPTVIKIDRVLFKSYNKFIKLPGI